MTYSKGYDIIKVQKEKETPQTGKEKNMTLAERNAYYDKWSQGADLAMQDYEKEHSEGAWIIVQTIAAVLADLDRTHRRKLTQKIQEFVWEHAYLRNEVAYERYFKSGYFKEKYAA